MQIDIDIHSNIERGRDRERGFFFFHVYNVYHMRCVRREKVKLMSFNTSMYRLFLHSFAHMCACYAYVEMYTE